MLQRNKLYVSVICLIMGVLTTNMSSYARLEMVQLFGARDDGMWGGIRGDWYCDRINTPINITYAGGGYTFRYLVSFGDGARITAVSDKYYENLYLETGGSFTWKGLDLNENILFMPSNGDLPTVCRR